MLRVKLLVTKKKRRLRFVFFCHLNEIPRVCVYNCGVCCSILWRSDNGKTRRHFHLSNYHFSHDSRSRFNEMALTEFVFAFFDRSGVGGPKSDELAFISL